MHFNKNRGTNAQTNARNVLHNPREAVVVRIGMGRKAPFVTNS
jgi:hypothetical protein